MAEGVAWKRVGLRPEGRAPMREGIEIFAQAAGGDPVGRVTSGGFGPTVGAPGAMGYVSAASASPGTVCGNPGFSATWPMVIHASARGLPAPPVMARINWLT